MGKLVKVDLPAAAWTLVVGVLLLAPGELLARALPWLPATAAAPGGSDRLGHVLLFLVLAILVERSLRSRWSPWPAAAWTALGALAYGAALEAGQLWVPGRSPDLLDGLANGLGALLGAIARRLGEAWPARAAAGGPTTGS
jgi:hypothetical protein